MATGPRPRTARRLAIYALAAASLTITATAQASALVPETPARTTPAAMSLSGKISAESGVYVSDLDGWIREALDIMAAQGIPGSYDAIHRNIMRESGGDPGA
ncbi:hypothetical protein ACFXKA_33795, partial [Nocardia sp. NPDC059228]